MSRINYAFDLQKLNPQFIGIAGKFSSHKKARLSLQKQKKTLDINATYLSNLDKTLQKEVQDKKMQLKRVQEVRNRLYKDHQDKQIQSEKKKRQIQFLHQKSQDARKTNSKNLKKAKNDLLKSNRMKREEIKGAITILRSQFFTKKQESMAQNTIRFQSIQHEKKVGHDIVNQFYRHKNQQSLNNYLSMIDEQDKKSMQYEKEIKKLRSTINEFNSKVLQKKKQVETLQESIALYTAPTTARKRYRGYRLDILSQASERSALSARSNPKDIILGKNIQFVQQQDI